MGGIYKLSKKISKNEKILVIGDYDVDGATSTALLGKYFNELSTNQQENLLKRQELIEKINSSGVLDDDAEKIITASIEEFLNLKQERRLKEFFYKTIMNTPRLCRFDISSFINWVASYIHNSS